MGSDEQQIRQLVATWMEATKTGDVEKVLSLMSDDAIFLLPGQPVMRKEDFAVTVRAQAGADAPGADAPGAGAPHIDGINDIQEIKILGDWAFMWSMLTVVVAMPGQAKSMTRAGHTLTILHKYNGRWVLARDANLLVPVTE